MVNGTKNSIILENLDYIEYDQRITELCYKVFENESEFIRALLNEANIWAVYRFEEEEYKRVWQKKQRYEDQVCGFLQYYDREVRNSMCNHTIYFHWGPWNDYDYNVVIFIAEPPLRRPPNDYPLYERKYYETSPYYGGVREIDPPSSQLSDPPKPPPPPPPY